MRRCDNQDPVGVCVLYPVACESEENFFLPPSKSLHLTINSSQTDPFKMAKAGDEDCTSIFIRSFEIDSRYQQHHNYYQLLRDGQQTFIKMQADFPNICDLYTLAIHPSVQALALAMGFQKTSQDPQMSLYWMYMPLDKYLTLDIEQAISNLKLD